MVDHITRQRQKRATSLSRHAFQAQRRTRLNGAAPQLPRRSSYSARAVPAPPRPHPRRPMTRSRARNPARSRAKIRLPTATQKVPTAQKEKSSWQWRCVLYLLEITYDSLSPFYPARAPPLTPWFSLFGAQRREFEVKRTLGEGSFGQVLLATWTRCEIVR
eukprot:1409688-Rhodomonas_salina.1